MSLVKEVYHDGWAELVLDRSDRRNAISSELADQFVMALSRVESVCRGVVLAAEGPVFCAGADLAEGMSLDPDRPSSRMLRALASSPLFVVAAVRGGVYGVGIALLAACPIVLVTAAASLNLPEAQRGLFPLGVVPYLEGHVPLRRLLVLGLQSGSISAAEALRFGLATELVPEETLTERAQKWAEFAVIQPAVALQSKRWWSDPILDESFQRRVANLESLLDGFLPDPVMKAEL